MCWFKGAFLPSVFIVFLSLITSSRCDSFVNAIEGESVKLEFPYPCSSTKITLQHGNILPFYNSALNPHQSERFKVEYMTEEENHCFLQLSIDPVKRGDGGTYILFVSDRSYITSVDLRVHFLPGVAHCSFNGSYAGDWKKLHCIASVGSMLGQIQCFQKGVRLPHLSAPSEKDKTLEQIILVEQDRHHVFCCSSQLGEPKGRCDCHDYAWNPLSYGGVLNPGNLCPTTTHESTALVTTSYNHDQYSLIVIAIIHEQARLEREQAILNSRKSVADLMIDCNFYILCFTLIIAVIVKIIEVTIWIIIEVLTLTQHLPHVLSYIMNTFLTIVVDIIPRKTNLLIYVLTQSGYDVYEKLKMSSRLQGA